MVAGNASYAFPVARQVGRNRIASHIVLTGRAQETALEVQRLLDRS